ncbi:MAG: STAS-like domain-containing protein [Thermoleophilaceae bacterium]
MLKTMVRPADDLGPVLTGRTAAARLREEIERELAADGEVTIDLEGVEAISPSFADELFAKLPREALSSGRVRFEHLDPSDSALARFVMAGRSRPDDS